MFVVTEDWYFVSHRLSLAVAALAAGFDVSVVTQIDRHEKVIRDSGIKINPLSFNRGRINPAREFSTICKLANIYRTEKPDILHHVAMKPVVYGSLAARLAGINHVVNALGGLGYVFSSRDLRARTLEMVVAPLLKVIHRRAKTLLIVQNADDMQRLIKRSIANKTSLRLIRGSGVDQHLYQLTDVRKQPPLVLLPARLLREKGISEFVAAASLLKGRGVAARFALVGRPDPMNPASFTQREIDRWVLEGSVEAWGWRDDMPAVLSQAQIVCLPTYHEGLPRVLLEAAASGCAIVASDIPGCREIIEHGVSGLLVRPRDPEALAENLQCLIECPALREKMGLAARELVAKQFSIDRVIGQTFDVYRELLKSDKWPLHM